MLYKGYYLKAFLRKTPKNGQPNYERVYFCATRRFKVVFLVFRPDTLVV